MIRILICVFSKELVDKSYANNLLYVCFLLEGWPSGQWQQTVNLPTEVYESSNLSPSTISFVNNCIFEFFLCNTSILRAFVTELLQAFTFVFNANLI